jgi:hypothetical protein
MEDWFLPGERRISGWFIDAGRLNANELGPGVAAGPAYEPREKDGPHRVVLL